MMSAVEKNYRAYYSDKYTSPDVSPGAHGETMHMVHTFRFGANSKYLKGTQRVSQAHVKLL